MNDSDIFMIKNYDTNTNFLSLQLTESWIREVAGKQIISLVQEKKSLEIYNAKKAVGEKDLNARSDMIVVSDLGGF